MTLSNIMMPYFRKLNCNLIIDLCSGSGGPTPNIHSMLNKHRKVNTVLTDLFPQTSVWKSQCKKYKNLNFASKSVDAASIQISKIPEISKIYDDKINFRTLFGSFHHFKPDLAKSILQNAIECNDAFIMSEAILRRGSIIDFIQWPVQLLLLSPFFIIFMIINILFVYDEEDNNLLFKIIKCISIVITSPIWVAAFVHDAIISNARCYTKDELLEMAQAVTKKCVASKWRKMKANDEHFKIIKDYSWTCWRQNSDMMFPLGYLAPITVLLGVPKR